MNIGAYIQTSGFYQVRTTVSLALIEIDRSRFGKVFFFDVLIDRQI